LGFVLILILSFCSCGISSSFDNVPKGDLISEVFSLSSSLLIVVNVGFSSLFILIVVFSEGCSCSSFLSFLRYIYFDCLFSSIGFSSSFFISISFSFSSSFGFIYFPWYLL